MRSCKFIGNYVWLLSLISMTGVGGRPEIIIMGSNSMEGPWEVRYRPGDIIAFGEIHSLTKQHFLTPPLVSPNPKVWEKRAKTPYWRRATTQNWEVFLIGWAMWEICFNQSEELPKSGKRRVIIMEFLCSFLRRYFTWKPVVASRNVGCFIRLRNTQHYKITAIQYWVR